MMMKIMNNHPEIHSINETHFFESYWSPVEEKKYISRKDANYLLSEFLLFSMMVSLKKQMN